MDLKSLTPKSDTVVAELVHPNTFDPLTNSDGSKMTIEVYAPHSEQYRSAVHEQTNRRIKQSKGKKGLEITAQELEANSIELMAKVTKDWNITYDDKQPKFSVDKAIQIYTEVFWLRNQIEEALNETLDFTKN